jgi:hypothetical protein
LFWFALPFCQFTGLTGELKEPFAAWSRLADEPAKSRMESANASERRSNQPLTALPENRLRQVIF